MSWRTRLVALLLFGSGLCALIYQTTWLREFRLVFGVSTAATAAVVGIFMAGMRLGGIFLGRRSERDPEYFMKHEAATVDMATLAREIQARSANSETP